MKLRNFLGLVIACLLAVVALYATSNIIIGGGTLLASLAFYYLYVYKKLECHANLIKKLHECYLFINNFLITLSIKESVNAAFEAVEGTISDEFKDYLESADISFVRDNDDPKPQKAFEKQFRKMQLKKTIKSLLGR